MHRTSAAIPEELDKLYAVVRGSPAANALSEAKKAFQGQDYAEALRLVRETGELYRQTHLRILRQDPQSPDFTPEDSKKISAKQAKIQDVLERFDALVHRLEKMAKLLPEQSPVPATRKFQPAAKPRPAAPAAEVGETPAPVKPVKKPDVALIDTGSFTQLQTAVQETGLVPNADAVGFVRDHEFREGKHQEAFDRIEGLFIHLRAASEQRAQRLRREELDFRGGVLKMSPKAWLLKQQRETAQTQKIDRALRYFARVLDGLRITMTSSDP
ncbi:MAG: hypothetical protein JXB10_18665 [Pirellulales bacterium]|nr:hypothetical protein [Pirellulales bacterium]